MIEWAMVGQQVVCINDNWWQSPDDAKPYNQIPYKDQILTIRHAIMHPKWEIVYFVFKELLNPIDNKNNEISFRYDYFRPVKKTSIDCFEKLLIDPSKDLAPSELEDLVTCDMYENGYDPSNKEDVKMYWKNRL